MTQMTLFPELNPPLPARKPQGQAQATTLETDTALTCTCGERGAYLLGDGVKNPDHRSGVLPRKKPPNPRRPADGVSWLFPALCERCLLKTLRGRRLLNKTARQPVIIHCADGFRRVRRGGREDFQSRGPRERVQPCARCKKLFWVHQWWTGEPALCPDCSEAVFREVYPDGFEGE